MGSAGRTSRCGGSARRSSSSRPSPSSSSSPRWRRGLLRACSNVSVLFGCLSIAFKFAEMDYVAKASPPCSAPSPPRDLLCSSSRPRFLPAGEPYEESTEVKRGIDMVKVLFEQILVTEGNSLKDSDKGLCSGKPCRKLTGLKCRVYVRSSDK
ncbi:hypothetical protein ZWY2020_017938 [Hordeum vulgare]|nr:hypothetical protein ZWY2020_017938 [Hordeum vulgare]